MTNGWAWLALSLLGCAFAVAAFWSGVWAEDHPVGSPARDNLQPTALLSWALFLVMVVLILWLLFATV
jgi:hypothetical protein